MRSQRLAATTAAALLGAATLAGAAACSDTLRPLAGAGPAAESRAPELFGAFIDRYTNVERSAASDRARAKLAQSALVPSRVFDDTTIWTTRPSPSARVLYIGGDFANGRYLIDLARRPTPPPHPGDTRHSILLEQLEPSVFRWDTNVDFALGAVTAQEMSGVIDALLGAPAGRTERELLDDVHRAFPRAAAAFGRGFAIDSLRTSESVAGTTNVAITIGFHPDEMRPLFPALCAYLDKYLGPAKYKFSLVDHSGAALLEIEGRNREFTMRYRVQRGGLVSLYGPPRAWPDSLQLAGEATVKVKMFTVGFHNLLADFVIDNTGHDRSWTITARREPQWSLPLITERLMRSPLRRPFEGEGALFRVAIHDSAGMQTLFGRRTRFTVQESPVVRFLGSLGAHALGDISPDVEADEARFFHDGFVGLAADIRPHGADQ